MRGLQYLAPHLSADDQGIFWQLVEGWVDLPVAPNQPTGDPKLAATYLDVCGMLGADGRFIAATPWIWSHRYKDHSGHEEPIPGFVRIPAGRFTMGHGEEDNNQPNDKATIPHDYFIARSHTTVVQYAKFVDGRGYDADPDIWGAQGLAWLGGHVEDNAYAHYLERRPKDLRQEPWDWAVQLRYGNRPVTGVTWFEARAYARWLNRQLHDALREAKLAGYTVSLPTEREWERAARANGPNDAHTRRSPWSDDELVAAQRANVGKTRIGRVSPPGAFAPNAIGLYDMAGNAWQWMDNLYRVGEGEKFLFVTVDRTLVTSETLEKSDVPALRGGSWFDRPGRAACSYRFRNLPGGWLHVIGFRVVLSLAEKRSVTSVS